MASDTGILVEAEAFDDFGGWVLDSQFELEMGSPYLLAHGNGKPVADATTTILLAEEGRYSVWVRTKDWAPGHHPGRFTLAINGISLNTVFGADDKDWHWQSGGAIHLPAGATRLALQDVTGFCGRCDAVYLSRQNTPPPESIDDAAPWRRKLRGLPSHPMDEGSFDVVVVGGGVAGCAAALTAARLGDRVAFVQDRPFLGGNASLEIGLSPRGISAPVIRNLSQRLENGDLMAKTLVDAEPTITTFMEHTVYNTCIIKSRIISLDARHARTGREIRLSAPVFIECTGKAILGVLSGAATMFGQESKSEYGESLVPHSGDDMHHGNTVFFRTRMTESPVAFPAVPWATEVAKDFSDLRGQLRKPGLENGHGPLVIPPDFVPDPTADMRMKGPLTHFWEYGQWLDPYTKGEHIRDHLFRAIYGTFYNVKTLEPHIYANLDFDWVAYVPAQGEYRRYKGDYVLSETDIREHKVFPDAVVENGGAFCLHYPGDEKYDFRLKAWEWDERDQKPYGNPFRCLYSANINNLMMAGKHLSTTHIGGSNAKFMANGGMHGIAKACGAHLCNKYKVGPRDIYENHLAELKATVQAQGDGVWDRASDNRI